MERKRKNVWRNVLGGLLLCLMAIICMPGIHGEAAEKKPVCAKNQTVYLFIGRKVTLSQQAVQDVFLSKI